MSRSKKVATAGLALAALLLPASFALAQDAEEPSPAEAAKATQAEESGKAKRQPDAPAQKRPDVVRVGALINDIQQLDLQSHSYNVDMYMWFKWKNPDINPAKNFEFLNAFELWGHILTSEYSHPVELPDGSLYQVIRNQGKFNTKLPLEKYPFDTQHLRVAMEDSSADSTQLVFAPDGPEPVKVSKDLVIPGWDIGEPSLTIVDNKYDTNFGDPRFENLTYSRAVFELPVSRPKGTYALKLLLPLLLVALTASLALLVHPRYVEGRIGIGITALLTLVALQITSNSSLPEVDYLILLDKIYIASYAFVVLTMVLIVRNSWVDAEGDVAKATAVDRKSLLWLMIAYVAIIVFLFIQSLA
jgi:hypothetical protein